MISQFTKIFEVAVSHNYYENGICPVLHYLPRENTARILKKYNILIRNTDTGFACYTDTEQILKDFLSYIKQVSGESAFIFTATTSDPSFYHFTDLPINQIGEMIYSGSDYTQDEGSDAIVLNGQFKMETLATQVLQITINFENLDTWHQQRDNVLFEIQFESRAVQLCYYVVNTSGQDMGTLSINGSSTISFSEGEETMLQNGQKALFFSTGDQCIPFRETPEYTFDLINTITKMGAKKSTTIFKGLPNANPASIQVEQEVGQELVSTLLYVYI